MAKPLPEWAKPGVRVAILTARGFGGATWAREVVIDRVTPTQIVAGDIRFANRAPGSGMEVREVGCDYYQADRMVPLDYPEAVAAMAASRIEVQRSKLRDAWERCHRNSHFADVELLRQVAMEAGVLANMIEAEARRET